MSNIDIIKSLYQTFERGDISSVLNILDPNVEWIESEGIPYGGTFIGHEAVLNGVFHKIGNARLTINGNPLLSFFNCFRAGNCHYSIHWYSSISEGLSRRANCGTCGINIIH
jgi:hypothetical protein